MQDTCSWRRASLYSLFFHLVLALAFGLVMTNYIARHPEVEYVIDLDMVADASNSSGPTETLFPEPLSQAETDARLEQAVAPILPSPALTTPLEQPVEPEAQAVPDDMSLPVNASTETSNRSPASAEPAARGDGSQGTVAGNGSGAGEGSGAGTSSGAGEGVGSGGNGGTEKVEVPFDIAGFADAVEACKQYPFTAIKRGLEGAVTMQVVLDSSGALSEVSVIGSAGSLLDKAALQAVRDACPYPNATGHSVSFTTTLHFILQ